MAPLAAHAIGAVARGPISPVRLPSLADAAALHRADASTVEDGYALLDSGEARIAIHTPMPGCTPEMVDWWFGWHSDDADRYKLWHPGAHVHAAWADGPRAELRGRARYVGRTSHVDEYLGSALGRFAISFVDPTRLGLDDPTLREPAEATVVCARVGLVDWPLEVGVLAHHVRRVAGGAEMRSRFWLGGPHAAPRSGGPIARHAVRAAARPLRPTRDDAVDLLVHCAEEMAHLARFLPAIHAQFGTD